MEAEIRRPLPHDISTLALSKDSLKRSVEIQLRCTKFCCFINSFTLQMRKDALRCTLGTTTCLVHEVMWAQNTAVVLCDTPSIKGTPKKILKMTRPDLLENPENGRIIQNVSAKTSPSRLTATQRDGLRASDCCSTAGSRAAPALQPAALLHGAPAAHSSQRPRVAGLH